MLEVLLVLLVLAVLAITIPVGVLLSRLLAGTYLRIFENLTRIARERLRLDRKLVVDDSERVLLQKYIVAGMTSGALKY